MSVSKVDIIDMDSRHSEKRETDKHFVEKLLTRYVKLLTEKPVLTKGVTSALVAAVGNVISQLIVPVPGPRDGGRIAWRSVFAYSTFGLVFSGPLIHHFYTLLDQMMPKGKNKTDPIKRIILDRFIFAPPFLVMFLYVVTILEGHGNAAAIQKLRDQFWHILKLNWQIWTPVQFFNVNYIPQKYRVLFGNFIALIWTVAVAMKRRQLSSK